MMKMHGRAIDKIEELMEEKEVKDLLKEDEELARKLREASKKEEDIRKEYGRAPMLEENLNSSAISRIIRSSSSPPQLVERARELGIDVSSYCRNSLKWVHTTIENPGDKKILLTIAENEVLGGVNSESRGKRVINYCYHPNSCDNCRSFHRSICVCTNKASTRLPSQRAICLLRKSC